MSPEILYGDYVLIYKTKDFNSCNGRIVAVNSTEGMTLKRLIIDKERKRTELYPVNKDYGKITLDDSHTLVGYVKLIIRHIIPQ